MKKVELLNYLENKTIEDRILMDNRYYSLRDYISFSKKIYGPIYKRRYILDNIFGIMLEIR